MVNASRTTATTQRNEEHEYDGRDTMNAFLDSRVSPIAASDHDWNGAAAEFYSVAKRSRHGKLRLVHPAAPSALHA